MFVIYVVFQAVLLFFPVRYEEHIEKYAQFNNIEKSLVCGIINAESRFDSNAVSSKGAVGLMQLKEDTALWCAKKMGFAEFEVSLLDDPETNIKIGTWYFSYLRDELGTEELAIIAYNAGITHIREWLDEGLIDETVTNADNIPFEETKNYIKKVRLYTKVYNVIDKTNEISSTVKGWVDK